MHEVEPGTGRARRRRRIGIAAYVLLAVALLLAITIASLRAGRSSPASALPSVASTRADPGARPSAAPAITRTATPSAPVAPPIAKARPASPTTPASTWTRWLAEANAGDAVAACRLATLLDDCRIAADVEQMIRTQETIAASGATDAPHAVDEIAALESSVSAVRARCDELPEGLAARAWDLLLQGAIAGHEPSMLRFLIDPPLAGLDPDELTAARVAYRRHAEAFLAALLQRASPDALALAYRIAQGEEFVAGLPIRPRDPAAAVRYGSALLVLRDDDAATRTGVDTALALLDAARARRAQGEGEVLVLPFLRRLADAEPGVDEADECARGWPGAELDRHAPLL
jgi:hypothetical protein